MNLKVNDTILYGMNGVCKVVEKKEKEFNGEKEEYYVLKPLHNQKSTIYIPVNCEKAAARIYPILSIEEIYELINSISDENTMWIPNEEKRKKEYQRILVSGDRLQIIQLIRMLYLKQEEREEEGKRLYVSDERFMRDAEKILYEEFSHVLEITPEQVQPFILKQIELKEKHNS